MSIQFKEEEKLVINFNIVSAKYLIATMTLITPNTVDKIINTMYFPYSFNFHPSKVCTLPLCIAGRT